jgi:VWFA-related protein
MRTAGLRTLILTFCLLSIPAFSQEAPELCSFLPKDIAHSDALHNACEFAISLRQKMPNFICNQETSRYSDDDRTPEDLISAVVRYEAGVESYTNIKVNGRPAKNLTDTTGMWSKGEFGGDLRAIFDTRNQPQFQYSGENKLGGHAAWVFTYKIAKQNDRLWVLRGETSGLAPAYDGELWIDQQSGNVLRFRSHADDIPATFVMKSAEILTDYVNVTFADGASFVLPSESTIAIAYRPDAQMRNVVQFRGCHKFRATAHMVLNVSSPPGDAGVSAETRAAEMAREAEQNEEIYSILQAQAIREDAARLEAEQWQELGVSTTAAFKKLAALQKQQEENANRQIASAKSASPVSPPDVVPTFKARANLVLVSVVLRNAKGEAVGNLGKNDFQLFNDRKPQAISSFSIEKVGDVLARGGDKTEAQGTALVNGEVKSGALENDAAYVFDDLHLEFTDLANTKTAAAKYLAELPAGNRAAIFTTSGTIAVDFTTDVDKLRTALGALKPRSVGDATGCPPMNYYEADLIVNQSDQNAIALSTREALDCMFHVIKPGPSEINIATRTARAKAFELVENGTAESEASLQSLQNVIARTAAMPGRRSIVLVSPGFLTLSAEAQQKGMSLIESALQAGIVVNTLDVSGLGPASVSAENSPGVAEAKSQFASQETFARNGVMADLAYGTGGTFFHNNSDLDEGFRHTGDAPKYIYVLGFAPEKLDGKFHKLKVTLKTQPKLTVQARSGYYALKPLPNRAESAPKRKDASSNSGPLVFF